MKHRKTFKKNTTWTKNLTHEVSEKVQGPLLKVKDLLGKLGIYYPESSWQSKYDKLYAFLNSLKLNPFVIADALKNPWFLSFGVQIASSPVIYILNAFFFEGEEGIRKMVVEKKLNRWPRAVERLFSLIISELEREMDSEIKRAMAEILLTLEKSNLMKMAYILYKITKKHHSNSPEVTEVDILRYVEKAGLVMLLIYFVYIANWLVGAPEEIKKQASILIAKRGGSAHLSEKQIEEHVNSAIEKDDLGWINWAIYHFLSSFNEKGDSFEKMKAMIYKLYEEFAEDNQLSTAEEPESDTARVETEEVGLELDGEIDEEFYKQFTRMLFSSGLSLLLIDALISKVLTGYEIPYKMGIKGENLNEAIPYIVEKLKQSLASEPEEVKEKVKDTLIRAIENPIEFWKQ